MALRRGTPRRRAAMARGEPGDAGIPPDAPLLPTLSRPPAGPRSAVPQPSQGLHPAQDSPGGARGADVRGGAQRNAPPPALVSARRDTAPPPRSAAAARV